ncbi:MAG: hypothetical protein UDS56_06450, partial [Faecalibacterium prausnitzii]|nr:hypothetical protein [Faecalibacterium prausnitzii]
QQQRGGCGKVYQQQFVHKNNCFHCKAPPYGSGSLFFTNLRKNLSHQKNPHEQCSFATKAGTMFHSFYTFFKKVLEHFWKVWYIIAILIRIEPETPVRKYFFYF